MRRLSILCAASAGKQPGVQAAAVNLMLNNATVLYRPDAGYS